MISVPTVTRQLQRGDVIEASDLSTKRLPERVLRKDTVTEASMLIGQSPQRVISPDRPIRTSEIASPRLIKKGDAVEMTYTTPYMSIRTQGQALEDGSAGSLIRVKNAKSERAVSARVVGAGHVELNSEAQI
jgi:flagella basal body P-ring formation protein FlgA